MSYTRLTHTLWRMRAPETAEENTVIHCAGMNATKGVELTRLLHRELSSTRHRCTYGAAAEAIKSACVYIYIYYSTSLFIEIFIRKSQKEKGTGIVCVSYFKIFVRFHSSVQSEKIRQYFQMLRGAHSACELSSICVRRAYAMAPSFNVVEQCSIYIACTAKYRLWTVINAFEFCAMVAMVVCHQVAIVFTNPWGRAHSLSRYHHHCPPGWSIAHSTRDIVLTNCKKWGTLMCLILCTI